MKMTFFFYHYSDYAFVSKNYFWIKNSDKIEILSECRTYLNFF